MDKIGLPYNVAEFANLINKVLGTGILRHYDDEIDGEDWRHADDLSLSIEGGEITLRILFHTSQDENKEALDRLRKVRRVIGGTWDKSYGYYMEFSRDYFGGKIELCTYRESACKKVVTGVKEIPSQVIPERIVPARTEEIVEWICDD